MYLKVANSAPAALPPGVRAVPLPTVVTPKGVVRGMGYVLVGRPRGLRGLRGCGLRGCGLRGLGYPTPAGPTPQAVITDDVNLVGMAYPVGFTPDMLRANVAADVASTCSTWPEQCPGGAGAYSSLIDAAVQQAIAAGKFGPIVQAGGVVNTGVPYDPQAYLRPTGGGTPAPAPAVAPAPPAAGRPLGVTLENASGGSNSQFRVGDAFRLVITGPANSQVTGSSQHDGRSGGVAPFGNTDSSGQAVITGTMTPDTVGGWVEQWYVGGQNAGSVSFSVVAPAPAPTPAPAPAGGAPAPTPAPAGGGGAPAPAAAGSGFNFSSLSQNAATVGGFGVPWWALLAVGGVAIYAMGSSGKR